jgi:hypothetical protein
MSKKGEIFKLVQEHLYAELGKEDELYGYPLAGLWIDKNMGQIANLDRFDTFPLPAILMEYGSGRYRNLSKGVQEWIGTLKLYIIFENYSHSDVESDDRDLALAYFEFCEKVHEALEGFHGEDFTSFTRVSDEEDNNHTSMVVTPVSYAFSYTDRSRQQKTSRFVEVDPELIVRRVPRDEIGPEQD